MFNTHHPDKRVMSMQTLSLIATFMLSVLHAAPATAFCEESPVDCMSAEDCEQKGTRICHREITTFGLPFMPRGILERVISTDLHMDHGHECTAWAHVDQCEFHRAGHEINAMYSSTAHYKDFGPFPVCNDYDHSDLWGVIGLFDPSYPPDPILAADAFGYVMHPAQDFYSHSNWLETFDRKGVANPPLMEPSVDLWFTLPWKPLPVRSEYLEQLGVDGVVLAEENGFDEDWPLDGPLQNPTVEFDGKKYAQFSVILRWGAGVF